MADGDAPPERFDHINTMMQDMGRQETQLYFLRILSGNSPDLLRLLWAEEWICPQPKLGQIPARVGHRSVRLPNPISDLAGSL